MGLHSLEPQDHRGLGSKVECFVHGLGMFKTAYDVSGLLLGVARALGPSCPDAGAWVTNFQRRPMTGSIPETVIPLRRILESKRFRTVHSGVDPSSIVDNAAVCASGQQ